MLVAVAALSLLLRRRAPLAGVTIAAVATGVYLGTGQPYGPILFVGPIWAWCLAASMPLRRAVPWLAGFLVALLAGGRPRAVRPERLGRAAGVGRGDGRPPSPPGPRSASRWPPGRGPRRPPGPRSPGGR